MSKMSTVMVYNMSVIFGYHAPMHVDYSRSYRLMTLVLFHLSLGKKCHFV